MIIAVTPLTRTQDRDKVRDITLYKHDISKKSQAIKFRSKLKPVKHIHSDPSLAYDTQNMH